MYTLYNVRTIPTGGVITIAVEDNDERSALDIYCEERGLGSYLDYVHWCENEGVTNKLQLEKVQ